MAKKNETSDRPSLFLYGEIPGTNEIHVIGWNSRRKSWGVYPAVRTAPGECTFGSGKVSNFREKPLTATEAKVISAEPKPKASPKGKAAKSTDDEAQKIAKIVAAVMAAMK